MIRTLLTTTALVAVMSTGAYAQDNQQPAETGNAPIFSEDAPYERTVGERGYFSVSKGQVLASSLIGKTVYNSSSEEAESIGDVNDIVVSPNGDAEAVIIGVGGFLGLGEKEVAIDFRQLSWVDRDGERWIVAEASKEELEAAPEYDRTVLMPEPADPATQTTMVNDPATGQQDTAMEEPATQDQTAMNEEPATDQTAMTEESEEQDQTAMNEESTEDSAMESDMANRDNMKQVDISAMGADELLGKRVYGDNNEDIGEIADVIVSDDGGIDTFVVDVGGFLGIDEKRVAIDSENIDFRADEDNNVSVWTPFTAEELEQQAEYTEDAYKNDPESVTMTARPGADKP